MIKLLYENQEYKIPSDAVIEHSSDITKTLSGKIIVNNKKRISISAKTSLDYNFISGKVINISYEDYDGKYIISNYKFTKNLDMHEWSITAEEI
jgi:hypothetical protein